MHGGKRHSEKNIDTHYFSPFSNMMHISIAACCSIHKQAGGGWRFPGYHNSLTQIFPLFFTRILPLNKAKISIRAYWQVGPTSGLSGVMQHFNDSIFGCLYFLYLIVEFSMIKKANFVLQKYWQKTDSANLTSCYCLDTPSLATFMCATVFQISENHNFQINTLFFLFIDISG